MKTRICTLSISMMVTICLIFTSSALSQPVRKQLTGAALYERTMKSSEKAPGHFTQFLGQQEKVQPVIQKRPTVLAYHADTVVRYSIFGGSEKLVYGFNNEGKLLTQLDQLWIIDKWADYDIITNTYDANGNLLTETKEQYRGNAWLNYRKLSHTYDGGGNCLNTLGQQWDGVDWTNSIQSDYTYDGSGKMLTELFQEWDGSDWMNSSLDSCTYNGAGNRITLMNQYWDGSVWSNNFKVTWTYNGTGNILTYLYQFWEGTDWVNSYMETHTYDGNGNRLTVLEQGWDGMAWMNYALSTWTYDANNNPLTGTFQECYDGETWSNASRNEWTYDATGNVVTFFNQIADWMTGEWKNNYIAEHSYQAGRITTNASSWTGTGWTVADAYFPVTYFDIGNQTQFFSGGPAVRTVIYYSSYITGIDAPDALQSEIFRIFPNPTNKSLTFVPNNLGTKIGQLQLYDFNGKELQVILAGNQIDISKLQNGVYLLKLTTLEGQTQIKRIVKI
jgi:hypothetical protein